MLLSSRFPVSWVPVFPRVSHFPLTACGFNSDKLYSWQVPYPSLPQRVPLRQDHRRQVHHQVPAEEGSLHGCRRRQRRHDRGPADLQHHVVDQLPRLSPQEGVAERWKLDHQGFHVPTKARLLDVLLVALR